MSDAMFVNGLALHAYHGVMQHEAKVGQTFKLDLVLDIDLTARLALRQARRYGLLRQVVDDRERGVLRPALSAGRGRRRRGRRGRARRFRRFAASASPSTSRTRRSPPPSTTSASSSCARAIAPAARLTMAEALIALGGNVGDVRAHLRSGHRMSVRRRRRAPDRRARPIIAPPPWGVTDQPPFVNPCIAVETDAPAARAARARAGGRAHVRPRPRSRAALGPAHARHRPPRL